MPFKPASLNRTEEFIEKAGGKIQERPKKHSGHLYKSEKEQKGKMPKPEVISAADDIAEQIYAVMEKKSLEHENNKYVPASSNQWDAYEEVRKTPEEPEKFVLGPDGKQVRSLSPEEAEKDKAENFKIKHPEQYIR